MNCKRLERPQNGQQVPDAENSPEIWQQSAEQIRLAQPNDDIVAKTYHAEYRVFAPERVENRLEQQRPARAVCLIIPFSANRQKYADFNISSFIFFLTLDYLS